MNDNDHDGWQKIAFEADAAGGARKAASEWLSDFTKHGPLRIGSVRVFPRTGKWVAIVTYSEW